MPDQPPPDPSLYDVAPGSPRPAPTFIPPVPIVEPPDDDPEERAAHQDALAHRGPAILGYTIFLIPLLLAPKSRFARYHANQAVLLALTIIATIFVLICGGLALQFGLHLLPGTLGLLVSLVNCGWYLLQIGAVLGLLILAIMGIINAANLEKKPLPLIGNFTLIHESPDPHMAPDTPNQNQK